MSPGHITARTHRLRRYLPASLMTSYDRPAMSGMPSTRVSTSQYQAGSPIGAKTKIARTITISRKLVPHRGCRRE